MKWFQPDLNQSVRCRLCFFIQQTGAALMMLSSFTLLQGCTSAGQYPSTVLADESVIDATKSVFPLSPALTQPDQWIDPTAASYRQSVLTENEQQAHFHVFKRTYFGGSKTDQSPWNPDYISQKLHVFAQSPQTTIRDIEQRYLDKITRPESAVFGENFRPRTASWKYQLAFNTNVQQFLLPLSYDADSRAIALRRSDVRTLPSEEPVFDNPRLAGQGYPFDLLQNASLAAATPVYIVGQSRDQQWLLVMAPEVLGWVKSADIGSVSASFVDRWRAAADQHLGAVIDHQVPVMNQSGHIVLNANVGTVLPFTKKTDDTYIVYLPVADTEGRAQIQTGYIARAVMREMPWQATPAHFSVLMRHMIGRAYGWGGLLGDNDCSAELRHLMMPFGLFLPRNSYDQSQSGKRIDLSDRSVDERIAYLSEHGQPFRTAVYIGGHIMLYIGNRSYDGKEVPMTYQNIWGLRPSDGSRRSIIGQAVFFPLLKQYKEDPALQSLADKKLFVVTDMGVVP